MLLPGQYLQLQEQLPVLLPLLHSLKQIFVCFIVGLHFSHLSVMQLEQGLCVILWKGTTARSGGCWNSWDPSPKLPTPTIIEGAEAFPLLLAVETFVPVVSQLCPDCLDHGFHVLQLQLLQPVHFLLQLPPGPEHRSGRKRGRTTLHLLPAPTSSPSLHQGRICLAPLTPH